ncbi:hypothetical protein BH11PLA1_BH11PLA1_14210 [soil metagenome]
MSIFASFGTLFGSKPAAKRTRAHRYRAAGFATPFGEVKDLSSTGMKIASARKPQLEKGQKASMRLSSAFQQVVVTARVAWIRPTSDGFQVGFQFVELTDATRCAIESLAKHGFADTGSGPGPRRAGHSHAGSHQQTQEKVGARSILEQTMHFEDLYALFGVGATADGDQIQAAYRKLAQKLHPDHNLAPDASQQFSRLNKAFSILKDEGKRKRYDEMRAVAAAAKSCGESPDESGARSAA